MSGLPLDDVLMGARFLRDLPGFLRHPVTVEEARATLKRRLENRERDFLALAKRAIYEHPPSPYRALLQLAGCEYGDLERLVRQEGVEGALATLLRHGVFLTVDEFKGRRPAERGSARIAIDPVHLLNPARAAHVAIMTSGSRGTSAPVLLDLDHVRDRALQTGLPLAMRGGRGWRTAVWGVPGSSLVTLLQYSVVGPRPEGWFLLVDPAAPGLHARYRWSGLGPRWVSRLAGAPLPAPERVPVDASLPIIRWMGKVLGAGGTPHLDTFVSLAARLCSRALELGVDLAGAEFTVAGEPLTAARRAAIGKVGARAVPRYSISECGPIGYGCLAPDVPDDMHVLTAGHAVIQPDAAPGPIPLPPSALLVSSLRSTAPMLLLNVSLGDQAVLARRNCGCPLESLGGLSHLHSIRSFEKLTAGGMTFLDTDLVRVLEEILPARFGGGATDYQLVEEEDATGRPVLRLLVHPRVGLLDEATVREAFLEAIGAGTGAERVMSLAWRDAKLLRVERRPPIPTASGKILHLHVGPPGQGGPRGGT